MSALLPVNTQDNFDIERQKINAIVTLLNNFFSQNPSPQIIFSLNQPINNQDILIYNSAGQVFSNVSLASIEAEIAATAGQNTFNSRTFFFSNLNNTLY